MGETISKIRNIMDSYLEDIVANVALRLLPAAAVLYGASVIVPIAIDMYKEFQFEHAYSSAMQQHADTNNDGVITSRLTIYLHSPIVNRYFTLVIIKFLPVIPSNSQDSHLLLFEGRVAVLIGR